MDYRQMNKERMLSTLEAIASSPSLQESIIASFPSSKMILEEERFEPTAKGNPAMRVEVAFETTLSAARRLAKESRVCVLDFANNHSIGGAPFSSGAQEEGLCQRSTLLPCLRRYEVPYYDRHIAAYQAGEIDEYGNDDALFLPGVIAIKDDEGELLGEGERYAFDVIVSAAPMVAQFGLAHPAHLEAVLRQRIRRILDIAAGEKEAALVLGAYGCGAFGNPPELVAQIFKELLPSYPFERVIFAIRGHASEPDANFLAFQRIFAR